MQDNLCTMFALLLALLIPFGCSRSCGEGPPTSEQTRAQIQLENGWNQTPWIQVQPQRATGQPIVLTSSFFLSDESDIGGSDLILEGLWWKAVVQINGNELPAVTGGTAPARIPVGSALRTGENDIQITIDPPTVEAVRETGGWLLDKAKERSGVKVNQRTPALRSAPILSLKPTIHLSSLDLPLDGTRVQPVAKVEGELTAGTVRFLAALDGEVLADLGEAQVKADGIAQAEPLVWDGPLWTLENPQLIHLVGILSDENGTVLDTWSKRTGIRQVDVGSQSLRINQIPTPLMAVRAVTNPRVGSLESRLQTWAPGGVNAIEIHGESPPRSWLNLADELGIPMVVLPRCAGRATTHRAVDDALIDLLEDQDARLVQAMSAHPSVVLWVTEGDGQEVRGERQTVPMWTRELLNDPQARPVVDHDLKGGALKVGAQQTECHGGSCTGLWLTEITSSGGIPDPLRAQSTAYLRATWSDGAFGGTIPTGQEGDQRWAQTWSVLGTGLGVKQMDPGEKRGMSVVQINGLEPGQMVYLEAPWAPVVGTVADSQGMAQLQTWYEGKALIRTSDWTETVELESSQWENFSLKLDPLEIHP